MQPQRGRLFLQVSSATLVLVATALYQSQSEKRIAPLRPILGQTSNPAYVRYESALELLEANQPLSAIELLASGTNQEFHTINQVAREETLPFSGGMLFLRLGSLLARYASQATESGSVEQARLFRNACTTLCKQLEQSGYEGEDATDRRQRLQIIEMLQKRTTELRVREGGPQIS